MSFFKKLLGPSAGLILGKYEKEKKASRQRSIDSTKASLPGSRQAVDSYYNDGNLAALEEVAATDGRAEIQIRAKNLIDRLHGDVLTKNLEDSPGFFLGKGANYVPTSDDDLLRSRLGDEGYSFLKNIKEQAAREQGLAGHLTEDPLAQGDYTNLIGSASKALEGARGEQLASRTSGVGGGGVEIQDKLNGALANMLQQQTAQRTQRAQQLNQNYFEGVQDVRSGYQDYLQNRAQVRNAIKTLPFDQAADVYNQQVEQGRYTQGLDLQKQAQRNQLVGSILGGTLQGLGGATGAYFGKAK
jgi:hypothetical protein